jgi:hypothetical protein
MKRLKYLILLFSLILSNACTNTAPVKNGVTLTPVKQSDASDYLNFADFFANASADLQKKTLVNTNQTLALNANDLLSRMKLVIMYSATTSFMHDAPKAQQLLQQILQENILIDTQLAFANLLFDHLNALNKINKTNRQDDKRVESLQQQNDSLQQKLESAVQKQEATQQKLDELKKIEKVMNERDIKAK